MKRFKKIYGALLVVGGAVLILTAGISPCCLAAVTEKELKNWPEQSYQGEELKKVRPGKGFYVRPVLQYIQKPSGLGYR